MRFADRTNNVPKSYIREILKVIEKSKMISFAGGLPNPTLFPVDEIAVATEKVLREDGGKVLQYSTTEGYLPLRKYIADRYYKNCNVTVDNILITNGSQQALDLISKAFINNSDYIMLERPAYLGAIQCFSMYQPQFVTVEINNNGIETDEFKEKISKCSPKLFYAVTNYQNPTGMSYSQDNRNMIAKIIQESDTIMIDDNPYAELRFYEDNCSSMKELLGDKVISLGSFSKIFAPSMRLGWLCASDKIMDKIVTIKQASDLHTNYFSQRVLYQYLQDNDIDVHIEKICTEYKKSRDFMVEMIKKYVPEKIKFTEPKGGMFLWMELPGGIDVSSLLNRAAERNVAFVPGLPFYANSSENPGNTLRLNYTNSSLEEIERGISSLAEVINESFNGK